MNWGKKELSVRRNSQLRGKKLWTSKTEHGIKSIRPYDSFSSWNWHKIYTKGNKKILESNSADYFPVTESSKCLGLISKSSLQNHGTRSEFPFEHIIKPDLHIYFDNHIFDILDYFISNQCVVLPVLDENGNYLGCINSDSLLNALANTLTYKIPGSVITLEVYVNDYSMSEISNIIESEKHQ